MFPITPLGCGCTNARPDPYSAGSAARGSGSIQPASCSAAYTARPAGPSTSIKSAASGGCTAKSLLSACWICVRRLMSMPASAPSSCWRSSSVHGGDIDAESAERVAREISSGGGSATAHALDVSDPAAVEALADSIFASDGHVDILHNNAGIGFGGKLEDTTVEDWQRVINVNLLGVAYGIQAFVPRMLTQGRPASVINTASLAGITPAPKLAPYAAAKWGVVGLTETLNVELAGRGI